MSVYAGKGKHTYDDEELGWRETERGRGRRGEGGGGEGVPKGI